jgi:hypothetical protein
LWKLFGIQILSNKVTGLYYKSETDLKRLSDQIIKSREDILFGQGQILAKQLIDSNFKGGFSNSEFKVFSQNGEDGILQYLIGQIPDIPKSFIEFGVESYLESNTRFLLMYSSWKGLVIDGSRSNIDFIKSQDIFWRYDLTAVEKFITKENINSIFSDNGFKGEIGVLSIDIDGNDYWVWENITVVNPTIIIAEYNSCFGSERPISVPYDSSFFRTDAHFSNLYFGASLSALNYLAEKKGFSLIGCNQCGNNAFFVRNDKLNGMVPQTVANAFINTPSREARDEKGNLTFADSPSRRKLIEGMPVINVVNNQKEII